jgi:hypothetical protein
MPFRLVDQTRAPYRGLSERKTAVIGRNLRVGQHLEVRLFQATDHLREENMVLKAAARQGDSVK